MSDREFKRMQKYERRKSMKVRNTFAPFMTRKMWEMLRDSRTRFSFVDDGSGHVSMKKHKGRKVSWIKQLFFCKFQNPSSYLTYQSS